MKSAMAKGFSEMNKHINYRSTTLYLPKPLLGLHFSRNLSKPLPAKNLH